MKTIILTLALIGSSISFAGHCPLELTQEKVLQAALSLEKLSGGGRPLTTEIYSYSSQINTWGIFLSYSGVQNIWTVVTSEDGCRIRSVYKTTGT